MEAFDTNVVVRVLVKDDHEQTPQAEQTWRSALASGGIFLPLVVVVECTWVLRSAYGLDRTATASMIDRLTAVDGVQVESLGLVLRALERFREGPADFADYVILEAATSNGAALLRSFDRRLQREKGVKGLSSQP